MEIERVKQGKPKQNKADIEKLKDIRILASELVDFTPLIIQIMYASGCTLQEIADVYETSRQNIHAKIKGMQF